MILFWLGTCHHTPTLRNNAEKSTVGHDRSNRAKPPFEIMKEQQNWIHDQLIFLIHLLKSRRLRVRVGSIWAFERNIISKRIRSPISLENRFGLDPGIP